MSEIALRESSGKVTSAELQATPVRAKIRNARTWRRSFEASWHLEMALAAGKHWQTYDRTTRTLRSMKDTDPRYSKRELYSADMVTEYRTTMLGELGSDSDRPQLLLAREDAAGEDYAAAANRAMQFGWDFEWMGDDVLAEVDQLVVDLGTAAVRCHYDASVGDTKADNIPYKDGKPVLDMDMATQLLGNGPNPDVTMGQIKEGRIRWTPLSVFNLLVPPGVPRENRFPWECIVMPTPLDIVKDEYGKKADELQEDGDIGSILGTDTNGAATDPQAWAGGDGRKSRLRDHVWLFTYFERPCPKYPKGRVLVFAGNDLKLMDITGQLPYRSPTGEYRSGISYFHWWRVTGRFWSRGLVSSMLDGQRLLDKRRTQINEIIDRSMPMVLVERGSAAIDRTGVPGEFVEVDKNERQPMAVPGIQPGNWMQGDVEAIREDIDHATGIKGPRLGENPVNVTTYSQLALINESEVIKRERIHADRKIAIARLCEDSVYDIRTYWGPEKNISLAGDDLVQAEKFNATRIPPFYILEIASGSAKPRGQAAKLKMVEDIAQYSINSAQPVPVSWLKASLEAGEALDLPDLMSDDQSTKAQVENDTMVKGRYPVPVAYYDRVDLHIPIHRSAQDQAMLTEDKELFDIIEAHVQMHQQAAQQNAAQIQQMLPPGAAPGGAPAASPGPPGAQPPPGLPPV